LPKHCTLGAVEAMVGDMALVGVDRGGSVLSWEMERSRPRIPTHYGDSPELPFRAGFA
jgi:hypothetical protein